MSEQQKKRGQRNADNQALKQEVEQKAMEFEAKEDQVAKEDQAIEVTQQKVGQATTGDPTGEAIQQEKEQSGGDEEKELDRLNFIEMADRAFRGGKFRRLGWSKDVRGYVFARRGETKLVFGDDKWASYYQPSQEDALANDWIEII